MFWYMSNSVWATISLIYLTWFNEKQLKKCYKTRNALVSTYIIEAGYIVMAVFAWILISEE